jgi:ribosome-associated protein
VGFLSAVEGMTQTRSYSTGSRGADDQTNLDFVVEASRLLHDSHAQDVVAFDVRGLSQLTDYLVIASGTSDRQIKAVAGHVEELAKDYHLQRLGTERDKEATWLVLDFVSVMVHLFEPATRAHYDLEMLWGDAPRIDWRR